MSTTTTIADLERGTNWVSQFAFHTGRHVLDTEDLRNSSYVIQKTWQVRADAKALLRFLDTFLETGDLAHLADYRGRLEVMLEEIDRGAWHTIVSGLVSAQEVN